MMGPGGSGCHFLLMFPKGRLWGAGMQHPKEQEDTKQCWLSHQEQGNTGVFWSRSRVALPAGPRPGLERLAPCECGRLLERTLCCQICHQRTQYPVLTNEKRKWFGLGRSFRALSPWSAGAGQEPHGWRVCGAELLSSRQLGNRAGVRAEDWLSLLRPPLQNTVGRGHPSHRHSFLMVVEAGSPGSRCGQVQLVLVRFPLLIPMRYKVCSSPGPFHLSFRPCHEAPTSGWIRPSSLLLVLLLWVRISPQTCSHPCPPPLSCWTPSGPLCAHSCSLLCFLRRFRERTVHAQPLLAQGCPCPWL